VKFSGESVNLSRDDSTVPGRPKAVNSNLTHLHSSLKARLG
jgi:hypothetical protein